MNTDAPLSDYYSYGQSFPSCIGQLLRPLFLFRLIINHKPIPILQFLPTHLLIEIDTGREGEHLRFLPVDVPTIPPRICESHKQILAHVFNQGLPFVLGFLLRFYGSRTFSFRASDKINDEISLTFEDGGAIRECGRC